MKIGMDGKLLVLAKAAFDQTYKVESIDLDSPKGFHFR
jgi:hypothetical protein